MFDDLASRYPFYISGDAETQQLYDELSSQTDRGVAVLGAAFLEARIRQAIAAKMAVDDQEIDSIVGTDDAPGELGFRKQCSLAYALGLFGRITLGDLERIARVRNRFAHELRALTFSGDQSIRDTCAALKTVDRLNEEIKAATKGKLAFTPITEPRERYLTTATYLSAEIWIRIINAAAVKPLP